MAVASQILLTLGDAPDNVAVGKSALFVGGDGALRVKGATGDVAILNNYAAMPSHYNRDVPWAAKVVSVATDRCKLVSPNKMTVNVNGKGFALSTQIEVDLSLVANWDPTSATDYTQAASRAGKDFYIYACEKAGNLVHLLSANSTYPGNYTADTSRKVGGFHCLCASVGAISGNLLSGYLTGDILPASVWDLKHRKRGDQGGRVFDPGCNRWVMIYLPSYEGGKLVSTFGGIIADGGSAWGSAIGWDYYDFCTALAAVGDRHPAQYDFLSFSHGSNQGTSVTGAADPVTAGGHIDTAGRRMISNIGVEDCCGAAWQWLIEAGGPYDTSNTNIPQGTSRTSQAGQGYNVPNRGLAGGSWMNGATCGSRASNWIYTPLGLSAGAGARGIAEPLAVAL